MSRGLGRVERAILAKVNSIDRFTGEAATVLVSSWHLLGDVFRPSAVWSWEPSNAQRKAVIRAMHSFVRKSNKYALAGGQGRRQLYIYEPSDPLSAMWAKLNVERQGGNPVCCDDARKALAKAPWQAPFSFGQR